MPNETQKREIKVTIAKGQATAVCPWCPAEYSVDVLAYESVARSAAKFTIRRHVESAHPEHAGELE